MNYNTQYDEMLDELLAIYDRQQEGLLEGDVIKQGVILYNIFTR